MSLQTYSRDYLQSIPEKRKKQQVDKIIQGFIDDMHTAAAAGMTSYRYVRPATTESQDPMLTDPELIAGFFDRFPGCKIYYEGVWVETEVKARTLKRVSIVIDWS